MTAVLTAEELADWQQWLDERPPAVRAVAEAKPPWHLYRVESTGQHATISSYDEEQDGTCTLSVTAWQPWLPILAHGVFGMPPDDLVVEEENGLLQGERVDSEER